MVHTYALINIYHVLVMSVLRFISGCLYFHVRAGLYNSCLTQ